jgi:uncharacterized protein
MPLHPYIESYLPQLQSLFQKYKIEKAYLFGSLTTGSFQPEKSDIDIMISFSHDASVAEKGQGFLDLYNELTQLFKRKVDLLTDQPIRNIFLRNNIEKSKILIYDRKGEKAVA